MPATLSMLTNVFPAERARPGDRHLGRRRRRSASPSARSPAASCSSTSGWGSVFLVNVPIVRRRPGRRPRALPESRTPTHAELDPLGAVLSIAGLVALLWAIIEAPSRRLDRRRPSLAALRRRRGARWRPSWSGSCAPTTRCSTSASSEPPLQRRQRRDHAGVLRPVRVDLPAHPVPAERAGLLAARGRASACRRSRSADARRRRCRPGSPSASAPSAVVAAGLAHRRRWPARSLSDAGAARPTASSRPRSFAAGLRHGPDDGARHRVDHGLAAAEQAGVGSAMNDTTRQVGGALGVAVLGSLLSSGYGADMERRLETARAAPRRRAGLSAGPARLPSGSAAPPGRSLTTPPRPPSPGDEHHPARRRRRALAGALVALVVLPGRERERVEKHRVERRGAGARRRDATARQSGEQRRRALAARADRAARRTGRSSPRPSSCWPSTASRPQHRGRRRKGRRRQDDDLPPLELQGGAGRGCVGPDPPTCGPRPTRAA